MQQSTKHLYRLSLAAMFIALGWLLPFLTGQIPEVGSMLLPMHLPAFLAGFVLGPWYGLLVGLMMPVTRSLIFGMPPIYPTALIMSFELATYGFMTGLLFLISFKKFKYHIVNIIIILIISMLIGRFVWGLVSYILLSINGTFSLQMFLSGAFITAWPGIALQLVLIPLLVQMLWQTNVIKAD